MQMFNLKKEKNSKDLEELIESIEKKNQERNKTMVEVTEMKKNFLSMKIEKNKLLQDHHNKKKEHKKDLLINKIVMKNNKVNKIKQVKYKYLRSIQRQNHEAIINETNCNRNSMYLSENKKFKNLLSERHDSEFDPNNTYM